MLVLVLVFTCLCSHVLVCLRVCGARARARLLHHSMLKCWRVREFMVVVVICRLQSSVCPCARCYLVAVFMCSFDYRSRVGVFVMLMFVEFIVFGVCHPCGCGHRIRHLVFMFACPCACEFTMLVFLVFECSCSSFLSFCARGLASS